LAQRHFEKSVEKSCSVMKMKLVKAKAKKALDGFAKMKALRLAAALK
jgi:hypothetical protein